MDSTPGPGGRADRAPGWSARPAWRRLRIRSRRRRPRRLRGGRLRRELAALEVELAAQTPQLVSLYETFGQLLGEERPPAAPPLGAEPLPVPLWRRPRFAGTATLLVLALVVALCATLSVGLHPTAPSCPAASSSSSAPGAATAVAAAQVRAMDCGEYPASK
jgi:hypothetical protein